ncbi:MAG: LytTR family DNA-binding domain-containing protein [Bacteroidota bacterium]|nr:LytTR family DNA-binding domain-containing protein [Bacteroidota bacterium]
MELRAIIIDDEIDGIKSLKLLIEKYVKGFNIIAETTNPIEGVKFIDNYRPDIVFLDINMPEMTGLELLDKINYKGFKLIFTTAHEEYALKALKLGTTDYLLKPIDSDDLISAVEKARNFINEKRNELNLNGKLGEVFSHSDKRNKILISDKEITEYCDQDDIIRVEAKSNYSLVVFKDKRTMLVSKTLKDFEKQLCSINSPFIRVHQSHIININHCVRYKREEGGVVEMLDETHVYLSTLKKDEFLKRINLM